MTFRSWPSIAAILVAIGGLLITAPALGRSRQTAGQPSADGASSITIECDLPADYNTRTAGGYLLQAIRVGFFAGDGALIRTVDIPRDGIEVVKGSARLRVALPAVPAARSRAVVRLQMVTTERLSEWSDPTGEVTLPIRAAAPAVPSRTDVTTAELQKYPALEAALEPLLGPGCQRDDVTAFANQELATAVVISQRKVVKFGDLCKTAKQLSNRSLTTVIRRVDPKVNRAGVIRAAQPEVKRLLRSAP